MRKRAMRNPIPAPKASARLSQAEYSLSASIRGTAMAMQLAITRTRYTPKALNKAGLIFLRIVSTPWTESDTSPMNTTTFKNVN